MRRWIKAVAFVLAFVLATAVCIAKATNAFAAGSVAYYKDKNGTVTYYDNAKDAWNKAVENNGTFGLLDDWDAGRRKIGDDKNVTIELNGHVLTRNKGKWANDGEVVYVGKNSTLTVYGGTKDDPALGSNIEHTLKAYVADWSGDFHREEVTFYGGMIHGGNSSNGAGGIHMKKNSRVNLYYTTVAGNRAEQTWNMDGYGGGVMMDGDNCYLYMDHSTISYNYAYNDGGGVYVDGERCAIEMVKSHIDYNTADDNGAGIYVNEEHFRLIGDAAQVMEPEGITYWSAESLGSSVSHNYVIDSDWYAGGGGGIYLYEDYALVKGINIVDNEADGDPEYGGDGGGVFIREENVTLRNCNIIDNLAHILGGGVENYNDNNTIDNCTIYGNKANDDGGGGGGIYTERTNNITLSGTTIIRGNSSRSYDEDNMYLPGFASDWTNAFIIPALKNGADVHIRKGSGHQNQLSIIGSYRDDFYSYDNDSNKHIEWDRDSRYLTVVDGPKTDPVVTTFVPDAGKHTQLVDGGYTVNGTTYPLIKGVTDFWTSDNTTRDFTTVFYYSDGYFMGSTFDYNIHLATMSCIMNGAGGNSNDGGWGDDPMMYVDKSSNIRQLMSDIGIKDEDIYISDWFTLKPTTDSIGVCLANKTLPDGKTLVIVSVRSLGYEAEWVSNFTLGTGNGEAKGFGSAANQILSELAGYLDRYGIDGTDENTKFWITGYSRGGAVANLVSKHVVDIYDNDGTRIYAYPNAVPKGGRASELVKGNNYNCIHNTINQNDIITYLGTTQMDFIRYGVDHFVPGDLTINETFEDTNNDHIVEDNDAWDVGTSSYNTMRDEMIVHAAAIAPELVFDDYFHGATVHYVTGAALSNFGWKMIEESSFDSDDWTIEYFIPLFIKELQNYAFLYEGYGYWDYRDTYAGREVTNGKTFEQAASLMVKMAFCKSADDLDGIMGSFMSLLERLDTGDLAKAYLTVRSKGAMSSIAELTGSDEYGNLINTIWKKLTELSDDDVCAGYHAISEYLTADELKELESCFPAFMYPILNFVASDYSNYDQDLLGTMAYNAMSIITNHYPEAMIAWLRAYDDFFENDTTQVKMDASVETAPGTPAVKVTHEDGSVEYVTATTVELQHTDRISLVTLDATGAPNENIGEAVYYKFTSGAEPSTCWRVISQPLAADELLDTYATMGTVTMQCFAKHYSKPAEPTYTTFNLKIKGVAYNEIPTSYASGTYVYTSTQMELGETVSIGGIKPGSGSNYRFTGWTVYDIDNGTATVVSPQDYMALFGDGFDANSEVTTVKNCTGASFRFEPSYVQYVEQITLHTVNLPGPVSWTGNWSGGQYNSDEIPVGWLLKDGSTYTSSFTITPPEGMVFDNNTQVFGDVAPSLIGFQITKYEISVDADNRVTVTLTAQFTSINPQTDSRFIKVICFDKRDTSSQIGAPWFFFDSNSTGTIQIKAPALANMEFMQWQDAPGNPTDEIITTAKGLNQYVAQYRSVIDTATVVLSDALTPGNPLPDAGLQVSLRGQDQTISAATFEWVNSGSIVDYNSVYTLHITMPASVAVTDGYRFAETVAANAKTADGANAGVTTSYYTVDGDTIALDVVFAPTAKKQLASVQEVTATVPHGSTTQDILDALPESVVVFGDTWGSDMVRVEWGSVEGYDPSNLETQTVEVAGTLMTETYGTNGLAATAVVTVAAADKTAAPSPSTDSGSYVGTVTVALEAESGATIYYALPNQVADGDGPDLEGLTFAPYTEPILLNSYDKVLYITAYAVKDGQQTSDWVTFNYTLTKPEVTALAAKPASITEAGNIACYYSETTIEHINKDTGEVVETLTVPDRYYADEACTVPLSYADDVVIPPFVKMDFEVTDADDANIPYLGFGDETNFSGLGLIGVWGSEDSSDIRVVTVVDTRILRDAKDYGYIFSTTIDEEGELTVDNADYRVSCKDTANNMLDGYGDADLASTPYKYFTASVKLDSFDEPPVTGGFYVELNDGTGYIYANGTALDPDMESESTQQLTDNVIVGDIAFVIDVTVAFEGGLVIPDKGHANPGEIVKVTVALDDCYELDTLLITCGGQQIEFEDGSFVMPMGNVTITATFKAMHDLTKVEAVGATCEEAGSTEYFVCSTCGGFFSDAEGTTRIEEGSWVVDALGHDWGEVAYVWADDYSTVTATRVCANDANHVETETVSTTSEITKPETATSKAEITYTAEFTNPAFETQTKVVGDIGESLSGWQKIDGQWYYYGEDGVPITNDWATYQGKYYYMGEDGTAVVDDWVEYDGKYYFMGSNGNPVVNGWAEYDGAWYYLNGKGNPVVNDWVRYGGKYYYLGADGKAVVEDWAYYNGKWYYLNSNGNPVVNGWVKYNDSWYYMNGSGNPVVNDWVRYNGEYYFMGSDGIAVVENWVRYNGSWYYMNGSGTPVVDDWVLYEDTYYHFNGSGVCDRSWKAS